MTTHERNEANGISGILKIDRTWKALAVIGGIGVASILGWNYTMAQAEDAASKVVDAKVNQAMIEGAKKAAADAVNEQLPKIAKEAARAAVQEMVEQQKSEKERK